MPRVSVITIFLNAERFLEATVATLKRQTESDWELVLVDDGSRDASTDIARRLAADSNGRIRYVEHDGHANLGLAASRNRGLQEARGDYILYLDSDDLLFPCALERLARALDDDPSLSLAFGATLFWNWDPAFAEEPDAIQHYRGWADRTIAGARFLAAMIADETLHPANCSTMMRRRALLDIGGFDPAFRGIYEDTSLMTELLVAGRARILSECLSAYRMHAASHCHTAIATGDYTASEPNAARLRFLEWAQGFIAARGAEPAVVAQAIARTIAEQRGIGVPPRWRRMGGIVAQALADPARVKRRLRPHVAPVRAALREIEAFYAAYGDREEAARATLRLVRAERDGWA
ncbi:glycosyltransferase family 2 protein [Hephaestia mangrovi]|uniref:glycosyltransferase family 2 protein n=1 Tax=Hephaestia mangrovi TaxID=2873268 RepID=UPI001CA65D35|nr:glycosyltransferase family A protein [Hephaestia mangrovi]MBY8829736.1 glycosyltransferase family 2 protein [Hephaestia mangrovi]